MKLVQELIFVDLIINENISKWTTEQILIFLHNISFENTHECIKFKTISKNIKFNGET